MNPNIKTGLFVLAGVAVGFAFAAYIKKIPIVNKIPQVGAGA